MTENQEDPFFTTAVMVIGIGAVVVVIGAVVFLLLMG